jgi:hypothetical protein
MNNPHGVPEEELLLRTGSEIISAVPYIEAMRDFQKRWPFIEAGVFPMLPGDRLLVQLVQRYCFMFHGGTHTTMPEDVQAFHDWLYNAGAEDGA